MPKAPRKNNLYNLILYCFSSLQYFPSFPAIQVNWFNAKAQRCQAAKNEWEGVHSRRKFVSKIKFRLFSFNSFRGLWVFHLPFVEFFAPLPLCAFALKGESLRNCSRLFAAIR